MAENEETPTTLMNNNSLWRFTRSTKPWINQQQIEIKTGVMQLLHANSSTGMDHEDPISHLKKFYEIVKSSVASDIEEENLYLSLFRHVLIERVKDWYLD